MKITYSWVALGGALVLSAAIFAPHAWLAAETPTVQTSQATAHGVDPEAVVKDLYASFEHGDMNAIERLIAPDATWTYYGPDVLPFAGVRRGPEGVADFFAQVDKTLDNAVPTQREFIVQGDTVVVPGTEESTVKATGIRYRANNVHVFKVRDGKIYSFEEYIDSGKVLQAFQGVRSAGVNAKNDASLEIDRGKAIFTTCVGCHGNEARGRPEMFAPALAGQSASYLIRQLGNFREGRRGKIDDGHGFQMVGRATAIPDEAGVRAVVAYIESLNRAPPTQIGGRRPAAAISSLVETCAACHGAAGEGNAQFNAPALNGLSKYYIAEQLENFRSGKRGYAPSDKEGAQMAATAKAIANPAAIAQLAEYYGSDK